MSAKNEQTLRRLVSSIRQADRAKTSGYDTQATVRRIEDGVAWVHIPGGVDETPVKLTIAANPGDTVQVRVAGGRAFLVGNATAPPTDDATAQKAVTQIGAVNKVVNSVQKIAEQAANIAKQAAKIAGDTNQYFWHTEEGTDTGAHITEIPQEDFLADPANGGGNLLARSNGIAIRDGLREIAQFAKDFIRMYNSQGVPFFDVTTSEESSEVIISRYMHVSGGDVLKLYLNMPIGVANTIEINTSSYFNGWEEAFTYGTPGVYNKNGDVFVYDGVNTIDVSVHHSRWQVAARANVMTSKPSFVLGSLAGEIGEYSTAIGKNLDASGDNQIVLGKYNEPDETKALIVGGGEINELLNFYRNILTLDWNGNLDIYGNVTAANIGVTQSESGSYSIGTANIDTYTQGPSVTLAAGVWVVTGQWVFQTGDSSGARNMGVQLSPTSGSGGTGAYKMVRVNAASQAFASLDITDIITLTSRTTVYLKGAASMTSSTAATCTIKAVRIK